MCIRDRVSTQSTWGKRFLRKSRTLMVKNLLIAILVAAFAVSSQQRNLTDLQQEIEEMQRKLLSEPPTRKSTNLEDYMQGYKHDTKKGPELRSTDLQKELNEIIKNMEESQKNLERLQRTTPDVRTASPPPSTTTNDKKSTNNDASGAIAAFFLVIFLFGAAICACIQNAEKEQREQETRQRIDGLENDIEAAIVKAKEAGRQAERKEYEEKKRQLNAQVMNRDSDYKPPALGMNQGNQYVQSLVSLGLRGQLSYQPLNFMRVEKE
eukprot:TRINITY_DN1254_c0_g1_i5.p1 TRINITY_DN1254_c0_g1~~TRINITY_DN1254_c0_g1_i5.p1  ORF type:complete len:281 (-),score=40.54 TRINITY_DN1254_c0_g1_i5:94-891(-)